MSNNPKSPDTTTPDEQTMLGRTFANGFSVSVVMQGEPGNVGVTIRAHDGTMADFAGVPYDQWAEINDFVRDATIRLLHPEKDWDGFTVEDVAIDILETMKEMVAQARHQAESEPVMLERLHATIADFRKRIHDASLVAFSEQLRPLKEAADRRAILVKYTLQGVIDGFTHSITPIEAPPTSEDVFLVAYNEGLDVGRQLARKIPEADRLLTSFIQSLTHVAIPLWEAHHGVKLDDHDVVEFAHTFHALFHKFSTKDRSAEAEETVEAVQQAMSMRDMADALVEFNKRKKATNDTTQGQRSSAGGRPGGAAVPDM